MTSSKSSAEKSSGTLKSAFRSPGSRTANSRVFGGSAFAERTVLSAAALSSRVGFSDKPMRIVRASSWVNIGSVLHIGGIGEIDE